MRRLLPLLFLALPLHAAAPPVPGDSLPEGARFRLGTARLRHGGLVRALSFSPDGKLLASASHDHTVSLWAVPSGKEVWRITRHKGDVAAVAFSPDGTRLATGGADGMLLVFDVASRKVLHPHNTRADSVECLAFSPDSKRLAVGCDNGKLLVFDLTPRALTRLYEKQLARAVHGVAWSGDGKSIATTGDTRNAVLVWDAATGKQVRAFGDDAIHCLAFAPRGSDLVTWEDGGILRLWDAAAGKLVRRWAVPEGDASALTYQIAFSGDGNRVFAGTAVGAVDAWVPATGKRQQRYAGSHAGRVTALAVHGDLLATGGADHGIRLHDLKSDRPLTPLPDPAAPVLALGTLNRGATIAARLSSGEVRLWETKTGRRIETPKLGRATALAPSESGLWLIDDKGRLATYDVAKQTTRVGEAEGPLAAVAVSGDGKRPVSVLRNGMVPIHDESGKQRELAKGRERGAVPAVSHDGALIAVVGKAASVALFEGKSGKELTGLSGHSGGTLAAAFSPDGRLLVTGGRDRYLRVWEIQTRRERFAPSPHADWVCAVAFSPDGMLIVAATMAGLIQLYDARTGKLAAELPGHRGAVTALSFAEPKLLLSSGQDGSILGWDLAKIRLDGLAPRQHDAATRTALWQRLAEVDAIAGALAIRELLRDPDGTLKLIVASVKPVDGKSLTKWLGDLDSEEFAVREKAFTQLADLGHFAEGALRKAMADKPGLEKHRRLEALLNRLKDDVNTDPAHRRALRSVEILERLGTAEARRVLRDLAAGAADAELTRQAKAALGRMGR